MSSTEELVDYFMKQKDELATRLSNAIKLPTISYELSNGQPAHLGCACSAHAVRDIVNGTVTVPQHNTKATDEALKISAGAFLDFHVLLEKLFPLMHKNLPKTVVNDYSLLFIWKGKEEPGKQGLALCAHSDVVPVPEDPDHAWLFPPFSGHIEEGYIWGRGALDCKGPLISICSAIERLLEVGYVPEVPYIAVMFGHDEEISGMAGAKELSAAVVPAIADAIFDGDVSKVPKKPFSYLLDEGLFLLHGFVPSHPDPISVVCVGEKGHVNVRVEVFANAGHSSTPPLYNNGITSIGILARALTMIETSPFPTYMTFANRMFSSLANGMDSWLMRFVLQNLWLTSPLLQASLLKTPQGAALCRTTTAITMIEGGIKSNVLPPYAAAIVNCRVHPEQKVDDVIKHFREKINDPRVKLSAHEVLEPAPVSSVDSAGFNVISKSVKSVFGQNVGIAPGLMLGNTDTRHYWGVADDIYRHMPIELLAKAQEEGEEVKKLPHIGMFHGRDEKIGIDNLAKLAAFYATVITSTKTA